MNKYSIILPVRNGGAYVKECVKSILSQSRTDFNLIVLDNCSTDGTTEWIESLTDKRIVVYRSERSLSIEESWSRIKGIPKNEFMTMIGHDDLLQPHYLQEMNDLIARHPEAGLYQTHFSYINETGAVTRPCLPMDEVQTVHEFLACQFARTIDSTGTGYLMRSADFERAGGMPATYPNLIFSDFHLWVTLMGGGYKATSNKNCFSYRVHQSLSRTTNGMLYAQAYLNYLQFLNTFKAGRPLVESVINRYGKPFMLFYCESLSHRLLKTPLANRSWKVIDFVNKCEQMAAALIPGQHLEPLSVRRIKLAHQLDSSFLGRGIFNLYKKLVG
jgi:glycosyltransferase involved in cell wall biosynthesis